MSVWKCLCRLRATNYFPQHKPPKCRRVRRVMGSTIFRLFLSLRFTPTLGLPLRLFPHTEVLRWSQPLRSSPCLYGRLCIQYARSQLMHAYITTDRRNVDRPRKRWSEETETNEDRTSLECLTVLKLLLFLVLLLYFCTLD